MTKIRRVTFKKSSFAGPTGVSQSELNASPFKEKSNDQQQYE
jgi:hypothetical protein